mmetsp:Transcript_44099/g.111147  ORF Transcript_44099/g.111147 Transcript_44099/m.111147 type:complete len:276 (+) Transcript_44099:1485-2312(+)
MHHVAVAISEDLHLNVPRVLNVLLHEHGAIAKRDKRFGAAADESLLDVFLVAHNTHAAPAAAHGRLQHDGKANLISELNALGRILQGTTGPGYDGDTGLLRDLTCLGLVSKKVNRLGVGANKNYAILATQRGKLIILRQEAVARVDCIDLLALGESHNVGVREVRLDGALARPDQVSFVGLVAMRRVSVLPRVDGHGVDVQLTAGTEDADGDFTPIRHEQALDGCWVGELPRHSALIFLRPGGCLEACPAEEGGAGWRNIRVHLEANLLAKGCTN